MAICIHTDVLAHCGDEHFYLQRSWEFITVGFLGVTCYLMGVMTVYNVLGVMTLASLKRS